MNVWVKNLVLGKRPADIVLKVDGNSIEELLALKKELQDKGFKVELLEINAWVEFDEGDIYLMGAKE